MKWLFEPNGELTPSGRKLVSLLAVLYIGCLIVLCFFPQSIYPQYTHVPTPGIERWGQVYYLPVPFNTLVHARELTSLSDAAWVLLQNFSNVFLLTPLVLAGLALYASWRSWKRSLLYAFGMSLVIETTQFILDLTMNAGRVVELDDLWTNALGGLVAYGLYRFQQLYIRRKES